MDGTTLPLWNESKHYYVGSLVTEMNAVPVGLRNAWFSAVGLSLGWKIENFTLTKCFYFSILHTPVKFQASIFNNKRKSTSGGPIPLNIFHLRNDLNKLSKRIVIVSKVKIYGRIRTKLCKCHSHLPYIHSHLLQILLVPYHLSVVSRLESLQLIACLNGLTLNGALFGYIKMYICIYIYLCIYLANGSYL